MAKAASRIFRDQRYPDQLITEEELKRAYGELIANGEIDPDEQSFGQHLSNRMELNGGTLTEVVPEKEKKGEFSFLIRESLTMTVTVEANTFIDAKKQIEEAYHNGEYDLDHNCFAGVEFLPYCTRCGHSFDESDLLEIDGDTPYATIVCDTCFETIGGFRKTSRLTNLV